MSKLFQTIGAQMEQYYEGKNRKMKTPKDRADILGEYFEKIARLSEEHDSSRVRFMLKVRCATLSLTCRGSSH